MGDITIFLNGILVIISWLLSTEKRLFDFQCVTKNSVILSHDPESSEYVIGRGGTKTSTQQHKWSFK